MSNPICPICGQSAAEGYKPFCCKRCADIDLARWLNGGYAIPGDEADAEDLAAAIEPKGTA